MSKVLDLIKREPIRVYSLIVALLTLAAAFDLDLSGEQRAAILTVAAILLGGGSQAARAIVTPNVKLSNPAEPDA